MAFPQIEATNNGQNNYATSHTIDLPASIVAGETLIVIVGQEATGTVTFPAGWTNFGSQVGATVAQCDVYWRLADGEEGASLTATTAASRRITYISMRISGATDPTSQPPESAAATNANSHPDTPSLTPTGGSKDYLWMTTYGIDDGRTVSTWPTNYTGNNIEEVYTNVVSTGMATRELAAISENPGAFGMSSADSWGGFTVAVHPAGAAGTNSQINIGDSWNEIGAMQINIGDSWKAVAAAQINIGDTWKSIF